MSPHADQATPDPRTPSAARAADVVPRPGATAPPWVNTTGYAVFAVCLGALGAVAMLCLPLLAREDGAVPTSPVYRWGCVLLAVAIPLGSLRILRVLGTPLAELPARLIAVPLLLVAPHWAYVAAAVWDCLCACVHLRVRPLDTVCNLGSAAVSGVAAAGTYHVVADGRHHELGPSVVLGSAAAVLVGYAVSEVLIWVACVLDDKVPQGGVAAGALRRSAPLLVSVGLGLCSVALATGSSTTGAVLGLVLLLVVLSHSTVHNRAASQGWLAAQLYAASERLRGLTRADEVPGALARELAVLWQSHDVRVADGPGSDQDAYQVDADHWVLVTPGRGVAVEPVRQAATALADTAGEVVRALEVEAELRRRATRDALTGLGNRQRLWDTLDELLPRAGQGAPVVVMSLDLDAFKAINDAYGHTVGDQLLQAVALRLRRCTGPEDMIARLAGDEFVVVSAAEQGAREALRRAHRLQRTLSEPFELAQSVITVTCSIGVHHVDRAISRESALSAADAALMRAKRSGRGTVTLATEEVVLQARRLLRLDTELRAAMHQGEFTLHYQPIVATATGETVAVEALLRWERDGVPQMGPADFIPFAEESGLVTSIGLWVLRRACLQVNAINHTLRREEPLRVSVNVSTVHIAQPAFVDDVRQILQETGLPPELLILEVTETFATLDLAASVETGEALREIGVSLWLDDFGTGYSSLEYLRQLPVEVVKLDRSFLTDVSTDPAARDYVEAIVRLCRSIGREPLAEGVELPGQRAILEQLGCAMMQGYLFARPVPLEHLAAALEAAHPTSSLSRERHA